MRFIARAILLFISLGLHGMQKTLLVKKWTDEGELTLIENPYKTPKLFYSIGRTLRHILKADILDFSCERDYCTTDCFYERLAFRIRP